MFSSTAAAPLLSASSQEGQPEDQPLPPITRHRDISCGEHYVDFDVRGNVTVGGALLRARRFLHWRVSHCPTVSSPRSLLLVQVINGTANIWCGEFKSSNSLLKTAKAQLLKRLALLEWAVLATRPKTSRVLKTGKLYGTRKDLNGRNPQERIGDMLFMCVAL